MIAGTRVGAWHVTTRVRTLQYSYAYGAVLLYLLGAILLYLWCSAPIPLVQYYLLTHGTATPLRGVQCSTAVGCSVVQCAMLSWYRFARFTCSLVH